MGTHVLLEAAKINNITRFVHVSTDEVYGEVINGVSLTVAIFVAVLLNIFVIA